jgi:hypothetical protein
VTLSAGDQDAGGLSPSDLNFSELPASSPSSSSSFSSSSSSSSSFSSTTSSSAPLFDEPAPQRVVEGGSAIKLFGRRWNFGAEDLLLPSICRLFIYLPFFIGMMSAHPSPFSSCVIHIEHYSSTHVLFLDANHTTCQVVSAVLFHIPFLLPSSCMRARVRVHFHQRCAWC